MHNNKSHSVYFKVNNLTINELQSLRESIDTIDSEIVFLLLERFNLSKKIGLVKENLQIKILDSEREVEVKNKWIDNSSDNINLLPILESILCVSKEVQANLLHE